MIEKLETLKKSFENKLISKEDYEKEKKKIDIKNQRFLGSLRNSKEFQREKDNKPKKKEKISKEVTKKSDKILIITIIVVLICIAIFIFTVNYRSQSRPKTIDELHLLNLEKGLPEEQGYAYNGFSFVKTVGLWHTQIKSESGRILYGASFHFSPKEVEDVKIAGALNNSLFNLHDELYITFDPLGQNLQYIALAVGEFDQNIIKAFGKTPVAACMKNETIACKTRPIITCENTNKPVVYFKEDPKTKVVYKNNCITIQGQEFELVRAVDRILFQWYGIMK